MTNYLVRFEKWSEFKAFIKRAFLWDININIDHSEVNETTPITDFEKICICVFCAVLFFISFCGHLINSLCKSLVPILNTVQEDMCSIKMSNFVSATVIANNVS